MKPFDCEKGTEVSVEMKLTASDLVILNNALEHILQDEDTMNHLFCDNCSDRVRELRNEVGEGLEHLVQEHM